MSFYYDGNRRLMMPRGLGLSSGVRGKFDPTPLFDSDFTTLATGAVSQAQLNALGWQSTRVGGDGYSYGGAYVQTEAGTPTGTPLLGGITSVQARMQEFSPTQRGLLQERSTTTYAARSRALATATGVLTQGLWNSPGVGPPVYSNSGLSPIVSLADARRIVVPSGGYSFYTFMSVGAASGFLCGSLWRRAHSGTFTHQWGGTQSPVAPYVIDSSTATTSWEFRSIEDAHDGATPWYLAPALAGGFGVGDASIAQDVYIDAVQLEPGRIPTSFVGATTGTFGTRGVDGLTTTTGTGATMIGTGNRLSVRKRGICLGPLSKMTGTVTLWEWVSSGGVRSSLTMVGSTRIATLTIGGGGGSFAFPTPLPDTVRGDLLSVFLGTNAAGVTTLKAKVNSDAVVNCGTSGALGAFPNTTPGMSNGSLSGATPSQSFDFMDGRFSTYQTGDVPIEFQ
jgi:hypothetical protein